MIISYLGSIIITILMRIAFFTYSMLEYGGGVAKYFIEVSSGLVKRFKSLDIDIITFDDSTLKIVFILYWIYFLGKQDRNLFIKEETKDINNKLGRVTYRKVSFYR